jgi:rhodanese-related sulfurtransferase
MSRPTIQSIHCEQLKVLISEAPVEIVDVRAPEEFCEIRAAGARNVPLDTLDPRTVVHSRLLSDEEPLYIICHLGGRSAAACAMFMASGYSNVVNIEGGTDAWVAAGLPFERGAR